MKKLIAMLMILMLFCSAAFSEALPAEELPVREELNAQMTFADVTDEEPLVAGPLASKQYIENYLRENPDTVWEIFDYLNYYDIVQHFAEKYPDAEDFNTYDLGENGPETAELTGGYCVTFHQNLSADDPFGGYTPEEYAAMIAITLRELGADEVYIGYYGNPEISFVCMDKETAMRFAIQHNQSSIYCVSTDETPMNPKWDGKLNSIRGIGET